MIQMTRYYVKGAPRRTPLLFPPPVVRRGEHQEQPEDRHDPDGCERHPNTRNMRPFGGGGGETVTLSEIICRTTAP